MSERNHMGSISISKSRGHGGDLVHVTIHDEASGCRVIDGNMAVEDFANALFGLACRPFTFDLMPENVGKVRELKEIVVPVPPISREDRDGEAWVKAHASDLLTDGWRVHSPDEVYNHHRRSGNGVRVTLIRFVDPPEQSQP